jgi:hypothetical protein
MRSISALKSRILSPKIDPIDFDLECLEVLKVRRDLPENSFFWAEILRFFPDNFFNLLCEDYPHISLFDKHVGIPRGLQRPHDRYYLSLNSGPYSVKRNIFHAKGVAKKRHLSKSWIYFIDKLESQEYRDFVSDLFQAENFTLRFAWHMGFAGAEISPHVDATNKLGTHIFYFNPEGQWDPSWGGNTVLLGDLQKDIENPEFSDFGCSWNASNIGNTSLIWRNTPLAWHGVRPLAAPVGCFRKIFTVVINEC